MKILRFILLFLADIVSIILSFTLAYSLKFKMGLVYNMIFNSTDGVIFDRVQIEPYFENIAVILFFWILSLCIFKSYKVYYGILANIEQLLSVIKSVVFATTITMTVTLLIPLIPYSHYVFFYSSIIGMILLQCNRQFFDYIFKLKLFNPEKTCVVGSSYSAQKIIERLVLHKNKLFNYQGSFSNSIIEDVLYPIKNRYKWIGDYKSIEDYIIEHSIKHLYVVIPDYPEEKIDHLVTFCELNDIKVYLHYRSSYTLAGVSTFQDLLGIPLISFKKILFTRKQRVLKRLFDVSFSLCGLIFLSPILLFIVIWIKYVSPEGPVIYKQKRVGLNQKEFVLYKFRTMTVDSEKEGPQWNTKDSNRCFYGGKFLRRYSLDELPQFINILKNEMSLIGPRPERLHFVNKIAEEAPYFKLRHNVKVGITGWAQIHGRAYLTNRPLEKFSYDLFYIKNWSLLLDIKIMLKTVSIIFTTEEAY